MRRRALLGLLLAAVVVYAAAFARKLAEMGAGGRSAARGPAAFVGGKACAECHPDQARRWSGSHHDRAMQVADSLTVAGDFGGASFTYFGLTSTFFRREGRYFARTDGPDGRLREYPIAYTFGVYPLQQYLIEFPGGRYQALNVCWDARPKAEGGQRFFHLYPNERILHDDILHWTGPLQNWNFMCAECHSTNLRKNYRPALDRFETTFSEIHVSCEACHGPGSRHLAWAREEAGRRRPDPLKGLELALLGASSSGWTFDPGKAVARRTRPLASRSELETCARCHARRALVWDDYVYGRPIADTHRVALLDPELYHADGQILDEVYEYGSFLQSRMHAQGVTCSDCHDAHSGRLRFPGNAVCGQCHVPAKYDTRAHHFHEPGTRAAGCVECHMASRFFMVVDARRDHSFRIPRPDLSAKLGTPNACTDCHDHRARSARWAAEAVVRWYGKVGARKPHYGEAIHAGRTGAKDAEARLSAAAADPETPAIARATALGLLGRHAGAASPTLLARSLADADPLVRRAAVGLLAALEPDARLRLGLPLLRDPVRTVRLEATGVVASVPPRLLAPEQRKWLDAAVAEYRTAQAYNADRAESHHNLGALDSMLGRFEAAEAEYREAIRRQPSFAPAYVNLADLMRQRGRDREGEEALRDGLRVAPADPDLLHALGLALARQQRVGEALPHLARAAELRPGEPRYAYVYAVALHDSGQPEAALKALRAAHEAHPSDRDVLAALVGFSREAGDVGAALGYAGKLVELAPEDPGVRRMLADLARQAGK